VVESLAVGASVSNADAEACAEASATSSPDASEPAYP
jgi:hypothetical protein